MANSSLAARLGRYLELSEAEEKAVAALQEQQRSYRRGAVVISENEASRELFVVQSGWLHSSLFLGNGSRQIMRLYFASDVVGLPLLAFDESPETVTAVTDVTLSPFTRERLVRFFAEHPRLSALLLAISVAERVALADRLASIGRTSALARVASLLCEIVHRQELIGNPTDELHLPLTQEEMGDATGLTAVHVNRMMRKLAEEGIIGRSGNIVRLKDRSRLCEEASFSNRSAINADWLANSR